MTPPCARSPERRGVGQGAHLRRPRHEHRCRLRERQCDNGGQWGAALLGGSVQGLLREERRRMTTYYSSGGASSNRSVSVRVTRPPAAATWPVPSAASSAAGLSAPCGAAHATVVTRAATATAAAHIFPHAGRPSTRCVLVRIRRHADPFRLSSPSPAGIRHR